jgi:hypothetical protein
MAKSKNTMGGNGVSETPNPVEVLFDSDRYWTKERVAQELGVKSAGVDQRVERSPILAAGIVKGVYPNSSIKFWRLDSTVFPSYREAVAAGTAKPLRSNVKPRRYSTDVMTIEQRTRVNEMLAELGLRPLVSLHSQEYAIPRTSADELDTDAAEQDGEPVSSDFEPAYAS